MALEGEGIGEGASNRIATGNVSHGICLICDVRRRLRIAGGGVRMRRHLAGGQGDVFLPGDLARRVAATAGKVAGMHRNAALQVGQRKVCYPVAPVRRPKQRVQRGVLVDAEELPVTESPALGCKRAGKQNDLAEIRFCHGSSFG